MNDRSPSIPAIKGGQPLTQDSIPFHRPTVSSEEVEAVQRAIESQYIAGPGPHCMKVEEILEKRWNVPRVLTVTSCTHAMELALLTAELKPEAEVIVPTFTYVSSAQAVLRSGGTPVFADVDPETGMITRETVEQSLTNNTEAVMMVHYGGFPGSMREIKKLCETEDLFLLEDAAQAFGSRRGDHPAGTVGRFGAISFHGTKSLTCGEGGILIVNNEADISRAEMIRDKGTDRSATRLGDVDRYTWRTIGSSYVLSDILGAVLLKQIRRWNEIHEKRRAVQDAIRRGIESIDTHDHFQALKPPSHAEENGHITAFLFEPPQRRNWMLQALQAEGIQAREHYHLLHNSPYAQKHLPTDRSFPGADRFKRRILRLPAYPDLSKQQIKMIIQAVEKIYPYI